MQESENLKIIVDKDKWAYTICLCIYNVSPQLSGQLSLVKSSSQFIYLHLEFRSPRTSSDLTSVFCSLTLQVCSCFLKTVNPGSLDAGKLHVGELPIVECSVADRIDALVDEDVSLQFKVRSILPPEIWIEQNGAQLSPELVN